MREHQDEKIVRLLAEQFIADLEALKEAVTIDGRPEFWRPRTELIKAVYDRFGPEGVVQMDMRGQRGGT